MMSTAPPLFLTAAQASSLHAYLQIYRRHALALLLPSPARNTTLRTLQGVQGKLLAMLDQQMALGQVILTQEERVTLKEAVNDLLLLYAQQPESNERSAVLVELASWKNQLKGA